MSNQFIFYKTSYHDGTLALLYRDLNNPDEPQYYNRVTVNLGRKYPDTQAHLDANHLPIDALNELQEHFELIELTQSGFVEYPLIEFDPAFINSLTLL